jgi:hypothetical protein
LILNGCSEFSSRFAGTFLQPRRLILTNGGDDMTKLGYVIAALGAIAVAAPSIASAETVVVRHGDHHGYGARAEVREHRDHGWHRHHDKMVVIKHRRHGY